MEWHRKASSLGRITLCVALALASGWACGESEESSSEGSARIVSFTLLPDRLDEPGTIQVSWQTANAESLFLIRNGDLLPVDEVSLRVGSVEVQVDGTSTFELVATGRVGGAAKETRTVEVDLYVEPPVIGSFSGPAVVGGDESGAAHVRLEWSGIVGATELILEAGSQDRRSLDPAQASDAIELVITEDTTFTLIAKNAGGEVSRDVTVRLVPLPSIEVFTTDRSWVGIADQVEVQWATVGAVDLELWLNGLQLEGIEFEATGSTVLTSLMDSEFELRAYSELGAMVSRTTSVRVAAPVITTAAGTSTSLWLGESIGLSWMSQGASEYRVTARGVLDALCRSDDHEIAAASSCEWQPPAAGDYLLTLTVSNGSGSASSDWAFTVGAGPRITAFTMAPQALSFGDEVLINWTVLDDPDGVAPTLTLRDDLNNLYPLPTGQRFARILLNQAIGDLEFTLSAKTEHPLSTPGEAHFDVVVYGLPTATLDVTPSHFDEDQAAEARLDWTSTHAETLVLSEVVGDTLVEVLSIPAGDRAAGSHSFLPLSDATYRLTATNALGKTAVDEASITVGLPQVLTFTADKDVVVAGQPVELSWTTRMAEDVSLSIFHDGYVREESEEAYIDAQAANGVALPLGASCGTPVVTSGCATLTFPSGFSFPFGGMDRTSVVVHNNGYLSFDPVGPSAPSTHSMANQRFPSEAAPFVHLAPFWDALGWDSGRYPVGNIHYLHRQDAGGDSLIIQWKDVGFLASVFRTASLNFEVILWSNGNFEYRYGAMDAGPAPEAFAKGSSATIGFQLPDRSEFDTRNFNTAVPLRGAVEGRTLTFRRSYELPANGSYLWHPYATQETVSVNLRAQRGRASTSKNLSITVHARPDITVQRPEFVGVDEDGTIHWNTNFASSVEVLDSRGVQRCETTIQEEVDAGSCTFQEAEEGIFPYRVRATGALGTAVEKTVEIKVHEPFGIVSFDADRSLVERGESVTLSWETDNAPHIVMTRNGEVILPDGSPSGRGSMTLSDITEDTTFVLRVTNGIGISVERSVFVEAWTVQFAVNPSVTSLRPGQTVSIEIESKGLNGAADGPIYGTFPMAEVIEGSGFQTVAKAGVLPLTMSSTTSGYANVNLPVGFSFPYFGERHRSLRIHVEGYVSFNTVASGSSSNVLLPSSASSPANVHLAPFWDNFSMHNKGQIYAVQTDPDTFVIQWTGMSLDTGSSSSNEYDLNFQLVLFRDGAFEYRYGKMAPPPATSTLCKPSDCTHEVMASSATIGYQIPGGTTGYTLHFGGGSSADTNPTIPLEDRTFRYEPAVGTGRVEFSPTSTKTYIYCTETGVHQICRQIEIGAEFGVDSFDVLVESVNFGDSTWLTWKTHGGTELRILDGNNSPLLVLTGDGDFARIDEGELEITPQENTTYTLELSATENAAKATRYVAVVRVALTATADVSESFPGAPVELEWTVRNADPLLKPVVIAPLAEIQGQPFSALDISGDPDVTTIHGTSTSSRIAALSFDGGFDFDFMGQKKTSVMVSMAGYLSFDTGSTVNATSNALLPNKSSTTNQRVHIAPFWESMLTRTTGRVIAKQVGNDTYVIQWVGMSMTTGSTASSEHNINFMVVLHRNGDFEYRYGTMKGLTTGTHNSCYPNPNNCDNEANGSSATIAYQNELGTAGFTLHHASSANQLGFFPGGLEGRTFKYTATSTSGRVTVTPYETTIYEICAFDPGNGDVFCAERLPIEVKWGISEFEAAPSAPVRGDPVTLSWSVVGLDRLVLRAGSVELDAWDRPNIPAVFSVPHIPTANTTYTLEGTSVGRKVSVSRSIEIRGFSLDLQGPSTRIFPGDSATISWNATQHETGDLQIVTPMYEIPAGTGQAGAFVDRSGSGATKLTASSASSGSAVTAIPFPFPYFGQSYSNARVYVDGFISFDSTSTSGTGTNGPLPYNSTSYKLHLAPFWDDLNLLDIAIDSIWTWIAPDNKSFVIQWKNVNRSGAPQDSRGDLNFQVVLYDDGAFEFRYGDMKAPPTKNSSCYSDDCVREANGSSATIGYQTQGWTYAQQIHYGGNSAALAVDFPGGIEHRSFRFERNLTGSAAVVVRETKDVTICGTLGTFVDCSSITLRTVADPGDLSITELMIDPTGGTGEQWFEVRNLTREAVDLDGFKISSAAGSYTIDRSLPVAPGAFVALAASSAVAFTPDLTYTGVDMAFGGDTFALQAGIATISSVSWTPDWTIPAGRTLSLDPSYQVVGIASNNDPTRWCADTSTGSPKALGEGCRSVFYDVDPSSHLPFIDISATGNRVFTLETADKIVRIDAPGFSMPFFDGVASRVWVSQNGWISLASAEPATGSSPSSLPRSGTNPAGPLIAAFWGNLKCDNSAYECDFRWEQRIVEGESVLILQWTGFRYSTNVGSITLQAQLWRSGDVVVAFGDVYSNDAPGVAGWNNYRGTAAWIGLEGPDRADYVTGHLRTIVDMDHRTFHFMRK